MFHNELEDIDRLENDWLCFIGLNVPSSKNSKMWTGKILIKNRLSREYEDFLLPLLLKEKRRWQYLRKGLDDPLEIEFYFFRDSKRRFDYINALQIVADLMQKAGWLDDDDADHFLPIFTGYEVTDKKNSGFKLRIINNNKN